MADLPSSAGLLEIAPVYKRQQESWDKVFFLKKILDMVVNISQVLRILSHLLLLVTQLAREPVTELPLRYLSFFSGMIFFSLAFNLILLITRRIIILILNFTYLILRKSIHQLVAVMDPRTTQGDSLLHLSVSKSNTLKTQV